MILDIIFNTYYWSIALGILTLGDIVVVPSLFFAVTGKLDFATTAIIIFIANMVSDVIWYWIGGLIPKEKLEKFFLFRKKRSEIEKEPSAFKVHGMKILFLSKFVYGIRPLVRVLCGLYNFSFKEYMKINAITTILWIALISIVAGLLDLSLVSLKHIVLGSEIIFTIFLILIIVFEFWFKKFAKEKFKIF